MGKSSRIHLGIAFVLLCGCSREAPHVREEAAIRAALGTAAAALQSRDFDAWAAVYAEDAVLQSPSEPEVRGRRALLAWARTLPPLDVVRFSNVRIDLHGDLAYATTDYVTQPKGFPPHAGKQLLVFRRCQGAAWEVVAASMSANAPLPTPPPKAAECDAGGA